MTRCEGPDFDSWRGADALARRWGELFYIGLDSRLMAVPIRSSGERIELGELTTLFQARVGDIVLLQSGYDLSYVAAPDGQRLLLIKPETTTAQSTDVCVIVNWADELARKAPLLKGGC